MMTSVSLVGFEVGMWPALLILIPLFIGVFIQPKPKYAITKTWGEETRAYFRSRLRLFIPRLCFFAGAVFMVLALADITERYTVTKERFAINRLFVTLDNSSSMYNFGSGGPIYCTDKELKYQFPRIATACRATNRIIDATEEYAKKKTGEERKDRIGLLRFGLHSFVETYGTSDYDRVRKVLRELNWRDPRTGVYTEIHLALWDMFQVALQRNFRMESGFATLSEGERKMLIQSLAPEGVDVRYHPPRLLEKKLTALRKDLEDTAFIVVTDAQEGQFEQRLDKAPVSLVKMMQLAELLHMPVYVISIYADNEIVRKLARRTGYGPMGGNSRGAFHLLKSGQTAHVDEIVNQILGARFRVIATESEWRRESYTSFFSFLAFLAVACGSILSLTKFGRTLTGNEGGV